MYVKPPGGRVWHVAEIGEERSLCGAFSKRGEVLDEVVEKSPVAKTWFIKRDAAMQKLSLNVKAQPEDRPN
jgi:hypothetical protein